MRRHSAASEKASPVLISRSFCPAAFVIRQPSLNAAGANLHGIWNSHGGPGVWRPGAIIRGRHAPSGDLAALPNAFQRVSTEQRMGAPSTLAARRFIGGLRRRRMPPETRRAARRVHIVGAGPVGLLLTALLQATGAFTIRLYEVSTTSTERTSRPSSIEPSSMRASRLDGQFLRT
jgi:hypothetical protein